VTRRLADAIDSIPINWSYVEKTTQDLRRQHKKAVLWLAATLLAAVFSVIWLPAFGILAISALMAIRSSRRAAQLDVALADGRQHFFSDIRTLSSWIEHGDLSPLVHQEVVGICNHYEKLFQSLEG
jgi:hypothetical protein